MARRYYIVPAVELPGRPNHWAPAYVSERGVSRHSMRYGAAPIFLTRADVSPDDHAYITGHADALAAPENLDDTVGGAANAAKTRLEAAGIPAHWITPAMPWRVVLRWLVRLFRVAQRYEGVTGGAMVPGPATLAKTLDELGPQARANLLEAASSMGLDASSSPGSTTLRDVLEALVLQLPEDAVEVDG